jgi:putative transposase
VKSGEALLQALTGFEEASHDLGQLRKACYEFADAVLEPDLANDPDFEPKVAQQAADVVLSGNGFARRRERQMRRFKSARQAQQFLSIHTPIHNHFQLRRHRLSASEYRAARDHAFASWREVAGLPLQANLA